MLIIKWTDLKEFKSFDKWDGDTLNLSHYQKAKYIYYKYYETYHNGEKVNDFGLYSYVNNKADLCGVYLSTDEYIKCISFINGKAVIIEW